MTTAFSDAITGKHQPQSYIFLIHPQSVIMMDSLFASGTYLEGNVFVGVGEGGRERRETERDKVRLRQRDRERERERESERERERERERGGGEGEALSIRYKCELWATVHGF